MLKKLLLLISVGISLIGYTQENLVPNHDFSFVEGKVKYEGLIEVATPWTSPTLAKADLYTENTKNFSISIPENGHGEEKPMEGEGYVGICAYSYKGKYPRTYIQTKLTNKLEAGKEYCVKFHVSLSDLSKYACNYLGAALTDKQVTANNSEVLKFDKQIVSKKLTIYEQQYYWVPVCGKYKANGKEQYITIGNFTEDDKLGLKKVKRPRGFTSPQKYDAYYYIDNISVVLADESTKCDCDVEPGMENISTVSRNFSSDKNVKPPGEVKIINTDGTVGINASNSGSSASPEGLDGMQVLFKPNTNTVVGDPAAVMDKIVAYMKANPKDKITIIGYIDASESGVSKLDGKRIGVVYKYLLSKGISKDRLDRSLGGTDMPVDEKNKNKNMRVEIILEVEEM